MRYVMSITDIFCDVDDFCKVFIPACRRIKMT